MRRLKILVAVVVAAMVLIGTWLSSRGEPRSITVVASMVTLPRSPGPFDNSAKISRVAGALAAPGTSSPCPAADQGPDEPPSASASFSGPCAIEAIGEANRFALLGEGSDARFQAVRLKSRVRGKPNEGCGMTLRAESPSKEALRLAWFSERKECAPEATVLLRESNPSVRVEGLGVRSKPLPVLGDPKHVVSLRLPLDVEQPVTLDYTAPLGRVELFESTLAVGAAALRGKDEGLENLSFVPAAPITFTHRVGFNTVWEARCEATPGGWVHLRADTPSAITLRRIELTASGLEVSFTLEQDWTLETGTCSLSSRALEWKAFCLTLLALLAAFGAFKRILDWLW